MSNKDLSDQPSFLVNIPLKSNYFPDVSGVIATLLSAKKPLLFIGHNAIFNKDFSYIYMIFSLLKDFLSSKGGVLNFGANAKGALLSGATPDFLPKLNAIKDNKGYSTMDILSGNKESKLLFLAGIEPELDIIFGNKLCSAFKNIDNIVAMTQFANPMTYKYANVILPITTHFETSGTFINIIGLVQHFKKVVSPCFNSKPLWKVLCLLSDKIGLSDFNYSSSEDVFEDYDSLKTGSVKDVLNSTFIDNYLTSASALEKFNDYCVAPTLSMYDTDSLIRRSLPLRQTRDHKYYSKVRMSFSLAKFFGLLSQSQIRVKINNDCQYDLPLLIDEKIAPQTILIPFQFAPFFGTVNIEVLPIKK